MAPENDAVIRVENLSKTYQLERQEVRALRGVTFTIMRNEFVAIMGPSGSGKSTLMNLIGCLDTPSRGHLSPQRQAGQLHGRGRAGPRPEQGDRVRLPGLQSPAARDRLPERRASHDLRRLPQNGARGPGPPGPRDGGDEGPHAPQAGRAVRAASASGWPSPGPWSTTRRSSWPTSRPGTSTRRPGRRSSTCSTRSTPAGIPSSSSPTTARSPTRPSGSSTSRTAIIEREERKGA